MAALTTSTTHGVRVTDARPGPGLLLVASNGKPRFTPIPLDASAAIDVDRDLLESAGVADGRVSRQHARVTLRNGLWSVSDLGSKNGTFVDGLRIVAPVSAEGLQVVRVGETSFLLMKEMGACYGQPPRVQAGLVVGPRLQAVCALIETYARGGSTLHIRGESGSGKEMAARLFHERAAQTAGPFVAVNCASIPTGLAERLLFGTRKGAYSGATEDAEGYLQQADGGTLFLDEIAELDLEVQSKLLRAVELREVTQLGGSRPRRVSLRLCSATHDDLRQLVARKRFRADLYYRIGSPAVDIPPLRERPEEIPLLVQRTLAGLSGELVATAALIDACLVRRWPGNVRELTAEVRHAGQRALAASRKVVDEDALAGHAGDAISGGARRAAAGPRGSALPSDDEIHAALRAAKGRVVPAARALGLHRNQLRRWLARTRRAPGTARRDPR